MPSQRLTPLTKDFPVHRLGALGDVAKVNCATCHQGAHKPLFGTPMAAKYPELLRPAPSAAADTGKLTPEQVQSAATLVTKDATAVIAAPP